MATAFSGNLKTGFMAVNKRLEIELVKIKGGTTKGFLLSAIEVRRSMKTTTPTIPVDLSNLKASWFITTSPMTKSASIRTLQVRGGNFITSGTGKTILTKLKTEHVQTVQEIQGELGSIPCGVGMGFTAFYAAAVHEMGVSGATAGKQINWSLAGSGAKFFQAALYRNIPNIVKIVQQNAKVRP